MELLLGLRSNVDLLGLGRFAISPRFSDCYLMKLMWFAATRILLNSLHLVRVHTSTLPGAGWGLGSTFSPAPSALEGALRLVGAMDHFLARGLQG